MALIALVTCVAYLPALNGTLVWNDVDYVTRPDLRSVDGLARIWFEVGATEQYYPLLHSFFWMQSQLFGDHPLGHHLVDLALHLLSCGLLYLILRRLEIPGAMLAAAIFALHPVMVESVAWITEQKNTLSTMLYLAAMLVYLHFDQSRKGSLYAGALALYVLAMASKTVTATLPAALLVIFWWQRGRLSWRRDVLPLVPWFVLGIAGGMFTTWVERKVIGAEGADFALTLLQRTLMAGQVPWFYAAKLLWPANLIFMYPRWKIDPTVWWQWLFLLATIVLLIALWLVRRRCRGPLAGCLLFIGTLVPVLGFLNVYWFVFSFAADHLQYLASLAVIVSVSAALTLAAGRLPQRLRPVAPKFGVVLVGILALLTWQQCHLFASVDSLYETTLERNPTCWMAHCNFAQSLIAAGRLDEAIAHCQQALALRPGFPEAVNNWGAALVKKGQLQDAIEKFQQAELLNPDYRDAFNNLGIVLGRLGRISEAIPQFERALAIDPYYADAHSNLALALFKLDRIQESIGHYETALRLRPDLAGAHAGLAAALMRQRRYPEAVEHYRQAMAFRPEWTEICFELAQAYAQMQQPTEATAAANHALDLARSQGQAALQSQISAWLDEFLAHKKEARDTRD